MSALSVTLLPRSSLFNASASVDLSTSHAVQMCCQGDDRLFAKALRSMLSILRETIVKAERIALLRMTALLRIRVFMTTRLQDNTNNEGLALFGHTTLPGCKYPRYTSAVKDGRPWVAQKHHRRLQAADTTQLHVVAEQVRWNCRSTTQRRSSTTRSCTSQSRDRNAQDPTESHRKSRRRSSQRFRRRTPRGTPTTK